MNQTVFYNPFYIFNKILNIYIFFNNSKQKQSIKIKKAGSHIILKKYHLIIIITMFITNSFLNPSFFKGCSL